MPFSEEPIDELIQHLENFNPILRPLLSNNLSNLIGDWLLIYASNGTVITRPIAEMTKIFESSILVEKVWQVLAIEREKIAAENKALIKFPLLGEYQLSAEGVWQPKPDERIAKVTFNTFSGQATKFLGQSSWCLPELKIPVLEFLRNENLRIARGATGNLFVFVRSNSASAVSAQESSFMLLSLVR
jgi:hypothetical protein